MAANLIKAIRATEAYSMGEETGVVIVSARGCDLADAKANGYGVHIYRCVGEWASVHDVPADKVQRMRDGYEPHPEEIELAHPTRPNWYLTGA